MDRPLFPSPSRKAPARRGGQWSCLLWLCLAAGCQWTAAGYNAEGVRYYTQGNLQAAVERFQRAIYEDPGNPDAYYNLARCFHQSGQQPGRQADWAQAESYYNQCLDRDPDHRECHRGLAVLLAEQGRTEEAVRLLQNWAQRSPTRAAPLVELARLQEELGDRPGARERLLEAIALEPYDPRARAALGRLYELEGNYRQALSNYQMSLATDRFQPTLQTRVAQLQSSLGQFVPASTPVPAGETRMATGQSSSLR